MFGFSKVLDFRKAEKESPKRKLWGFFCVNKVGTGKM